MKIGRPGSQVKLIVLWTRVIVAKVVNCWSDSVYILKLEPTRFSDRFKHGDKGAGKGKEKLRKTPGFNGLQQHYGFSISQYFPFGYP